MFVITTIVAIVTVIKFTTVVPIYNHCYYWCIITACFIKLSLLLFSMLSVLLLLSMFFDVNIAILAKCQLGHKGSNLHIWGMLTICLAQLDAFFSQSGTVYKQSMKRSAFESKVPDACVPGSSRMTCQTWNCRAQSDC